MQRYGKTASSYGLIDDLAFGYSGNRMMYVNDAIQASDVDQSFHFRDRNSSTGNEFEYDGNGNMIKDNNKNITGIQYNILNLPKRVLLSDNRQATYIYDAAGVKQRVIHQGGGESKDTEYSGNVIYENRGLSKVFTEEGYITFTHDGIPTYHYYLKDHLGNNRVVIKQDGTVEQVNHYYPFGGVFDQTAEDLQAYKYNGKELDRTYGLDLYDYSARYMDGALGRFTTMDPLSEKYYAISPYAYCVNNPVRFIDPTGEGVLDFFSSIGSQFATALDQQLEFLGYFFSKPLGTMGQIVSDYFGRSTGEALYDTYDTATFGTLSRSVNFVGAVASDIDGGDGSATGAYFGELAANTLVEAGTATLGVGVGKALGGLSKGVKGAAKTASKATTSSIETGGGAVVSNISKGEALRIQNAATKINKTISVVGSRAAGKAGAYSDWDYVIKGLTNKQWKSVKNSLPGSKSIMDNTPRNIDIHQPPLQVDKPYIMFHPKK